MAATKLVCSVLTIVVCIIIGCSSIVGATTWCLARDDINTDFLQTQLDYACGNGADCGPIQPGGLCFNPNTIYTHASYAYNSYYVRMGKTSGGCNFGGTAILAFTDPSYGSCQYPASLNKRNNEATSTTMTE